MKPRSNITTVIARSVISLHPTLRTSRPTIATPRCAARRASIPSFHNPSILEALHVDFLRHGPLPSKNFGNAQRTEGLAANLEAIDVLPVVRTPKCDVDADDFFFGHAESLPVERILRIVVGVPETSTAVVGEESCANDFEVRLRPRSFVR